MYCTQSQDAFHYQAPEDVEVASSMCRLFFIFLKANVITLPAYAMENPLEGIRQKYLDLRNLFEADAAGHGRAGLVDEQRDLVQHYRSWSDLIHWLHIVTADSLIGLSGYIVCVSTVGVVVRVATILSLRLRLAIFTGIACILQIGRGRHRLSGLDARRFELCLAHFTERQQRNAHEQ